MKVRKAQIRSPADDVLVGWWDEVRGEAHQAVSERVA